MDRASKIPQELGVRDWRYIIDALKLREEQMMGKALADLDEECEYIRGLVQEIETGLLRSGIDKGRW
jgi:hypothetical protein